MLTLKEVEFLQEELKTAQNPLFFYDGDGDGLCAFLLLYRIHREGRGSIVKASPKIDASYLRKVDEYNPDKIFVLDVPMIEEEFVEKAKRPIFWIDHHGPCPVKNVYYFNPKLKDPMAYIPTSRMAYQVSQNPDDLWIATVGCLFDWHLPDFIDEFIARYPHLLSSKTDLATAVYQEPIGKLVRIFSFLLKGKHTDVVKSIKILTRIEKPEEIMLQESAPGKYLYKHFEKINQRYEALIAAAKEGVGRGKFLIFTYTDREWSFTADLANELSALHPQKVVIVARSKSGEMKCSLRSQQLLASALEKALVGIQGYGGGHDHACGAVIKQEDWERFLQRLKEELKHV